MSRVAVVLAFVAGLAMPAGAEAFWQYRGHVADANRTSVQLVVQHRDGRPRALVGASTGRLELPCEHGTQRRRMSVGEPGFGSGGLGLVRGRFSESVVGGSLSIGPGGTHHRTSYSASMRGGVHRQTAAGILRLRTNTHRRKGKCDSGRLRWHARFVPRLG